MGEDAPDTVEQGLVLSVSEIDPTMARPVRAVPGHNWGPFQIADPRRRVWQYEERNGDTPECGISLAWVTAVAGVSMLA